jgi:hypothetical protein
MENIQSTDILRISKICQNYRYVTAITTFSGFQMFEYVGDTCTFSLAAFIEYKLIFKG